MPMAGVILGAIALVLGIFTMVKANNTQKAVAAQSDEIAKLTNLENDMRAASAKSETDLRNLRTEVQRAFDGVSTTFNDINAKLAKIEEAMKKPAPATAGAKGGATPVPTGTVNADGTYTVAAGDTPIAISRKLGVKLDALLAENPGLEPRNLRPGQKIRVPKR